MEVGVELNDIRVSRESEVDLQLLFHLFVELVLVEQLLVDHFDGNSFAGSLLDG